MEDTFQEISMSILQSIYQKSANKASGKQSINCFSFVLCSHLSGHGLHKNSPYTFQWSCALYWGSTAQTKNSVLRQRTPKNTFPCPSYSISILWFTHLAMKNSSSCRWPSSTTFVFLPSDKLCNKNAKYLQTSDKLSNPNLTHLLMH